MTSFNEINDRLDAFIRKYYQNRLVQGGLLTFGALLTALMSAAFLEYLGHFGGTVRLILFYGFVLSATAITVRYIAIPLFKLNKLGSTMTQEDASRLIGLHFPEIKDRLLNTLQLNSQLNNQENTLLLASINQRIQTLKPFQFSSAISFPDSVKRYGKYALLPLILFSAVLIFQSHVILEPVKRIVQYEKTFAVAAPFEFILKNKPLKAVRNKDFEIVLHMQGKTLPDEVFVVIDGNTIKMEKEGKADYRYTITNVQKSHQIYFVANQFKSESSEIILVPNPGLNFLDIRLTYPAYTGRKSEVVNNHGDLHIPAGTVIDWMFHTRDAGELLFEMDGKRTVLGVSGDRSAYKYKATRSTAYAILPLNSLSVNSDTLKYRIDVIPDQHPVISAEEKMDSTQLNVVYAIGKAGDDYGLTKLLFNYRYTSSAVAHRPLNQIIQSVIPITPGRDAIFIHTIDFKAMGVEPEDELEYYFEVWDNDQVNGSKSSRTEIRTYRAADEKERDKQAENNSKALKNDITQSIAESHRLQQRAEELEKDLKDDRNLDWKQIQKIQEFLDEQKKLEIKLQEIQKENELRKQLESDKILSEEMLEKQKEIDKLFKELMSPEMKEMLKKLEELLKQQDKEQLQKQLEEMKLDNKDLNKQLDRMLEQFKQLELEKNILEQIDKLSRLSEQQKDLAGKTEKKDLKKDELLNEQQKLEDKFEDIKEEMKEIDKKNEALESPLNLDKTEEETEEISKEIDGAQEDLDKKQNSKAGQKQKKAAESMQELASKMQKSLEEAQQEQQEEDYYALRQILENLIELSERQEDLMAEMKKLKGYSPRFVTLSQEQQKLKREAEMVEDSLMALSKRQIQIQSFVNKELTRINDNMEASIRYFSERDINSGAVRQQYTMTSMNNLAVMLSESLKNMQEQMNQSKKSQSGSCQNPGKKPGKKPGKEGKPKMGGMKKTQDEIGKALEEMMGKVKDGKRPMSMEFAIIAAQQEKLRNELGKLERMLKEEGKEGALGNIAKTKELMNQLEKDLANKQLNTETIRRKKEIETRMLEHEKAEREQEQDNQRQSETGSDPIREIPPSIQEYLKLKAKEMELLRTVPPELTPYYRQKVREYFDGLGS